MWVSHPDCGSVLSLKGGNPSPDSSAAQVPGSTDPEPRAIPRRVPKREALRPARFRSPASPARRVAARVDSTQSHGQVRAGEGGTAQPGLLAL